MKSKPARVGRDEPRRVPGALRRGAARPARRPRHPGRPRLGRRAGHARRRAPGCAEVEVLVTSWGAPQLTAERLAAAPDAAGGASTVRAASGRWSPTRCGGGASRSPAPPTPTPSRWRSTPWPRSSSPARRRPSSPRTSGRAYSGWGTSPATATCPTTGGPSASSASPGSAGGSSTCCELLDGATCLVADPYADAAEVAAGRRAPWSTLDDLLPRADVLSLHAPELPETRHMIGAAGAGAAARPRHGDQHRARQPGRLRPRWPPSARPAGCSRSSTSPTRSRCPPTTRCGGWPERHDHAAHRRLARHRDLRLTDHTLDELARWTAGEPLRTEITADSMALHA